MALSARDEEEYFRVLPRVQNGFKFHRLHHSENDDVVVRDEEWIKSEHAEPVAAAGNFVVIFLQWLRFLIHIYIEYMLFSLMRNGDLFQQLIFSLHLK